MALKLSDAGFLDHLKMSQNRSPEIHFNLIEKWKNCTYPVVKNVWSVVWPCGCHQTIAETLRNTSNINKLVVRPIFLQEIIEKVASYTWPSLEGGWGDLLQKERFRLKKGTWITFHDMWPFILPFIPNQASYRVNWCPLWRCKCFWRHWRQSGDPRGRENWKLP